MILLLQTPVVPFPLLIEISLVKFPKGGVVCACSEQEASKLIVKIFKVILTHGE